MNNNVKYLLIILGVAAGVALCWYLSSVLIYVIIAAVISMIARPLVNQIVKIHIKKWSVPRWLAALFSLVVIGSVFLGIFSLISPLIGEIVQTLSSINIYALESDLKGPIGDLNEYLRTTFSSLGDTWRIEVAILEELKKLFDPSLFSNILNSVSGFIIDIFIGAFSVTFISFFLLKEDDILLNFIHKVLPDKFHDNTVKAANSINNLLSRYFIGIFLESLFIAIINSLALIFIAKVNPPLAIVIGALSGILNVIPYVGPLIGHLLAASMGLVTYFGSGLEVGLGVHILTILAITFATQLIDNYVFQPLIYSSSVKAHPLEIFIVILIGGTIGGITGMFIAIPSYTVLRVIAQEYLTSFKISRIFTNSN